MAIACYLAMTAAEFLSCSQLPPHIGWLACHFSPSGSGLSNLPDVLPTNSVLIVDDSTPFYQHQRELILRQLQDAVAALDAKAVILDFQRLGDPDVKELTAVLQNELPCPVAAPPAYAENGAPVFLPPAPLYLPLSRWLAPYRGREIWLDAAPIPTKITVTTKGCQYQPIPMENVCNTPHLDSSLHCRYGTEIRQDSVIFTLARDEECFQSWLWEAESLGVAAVIGLYQEFRK